MKKIIIFVLITVLMLLSCKNNTTNVDTDNNDEISTVTPEELEKYGIDIDTATKEIIEEALNKYYQDKGEYKLILKGTSTKVYDGMKNGDTIAGMVEKTKIKNVVVSAEHVKFENNKIKDSTFGGDQNYNTSIVKITIQNTITEIGNNVFNCRSLTNLNIPKSLVKIGDNSIRSTLVKKIELPKTLTYIGDRGFYGSTKIEELHIPDPVTHIGMSAFTDCPKLKKIRLPNKLEILDDSVFERCSSLQSITIPSSVTEIKDNAFYYSKVLENITFLSAAPPTIGKSVFNGTAIKNIYVPKGSKAQYEQLKGKSGIPQTVNIVELQ